ncbi:MAG TPA: MMPL family transporter [Thermotogota bacterium]|nr:MMPL family transporter [Thermotogota bacterium]HPJ88337.1 MMPL family transporter [Thermotogota bacterium]HPR95495.1 MMPL family transporter [Thermotogota bacterium]
MERLGKFIVRYRVMLIIAVALLTLFFGWKSLGLKFDDDITKYPPQSDPFVSHFTDLSEEFGIGSLVMIGMDIEDNTDLIKINEITGYLSERTDVQSVSSLSNMPIVNISDYGIEVITLSDEIANGSITVRDVLQHDSIVGKFISNDGKSSLITFSIKEGMDTKNVYGTIREALDKKYGDHFHYYGVSPVNNAVESIAKRNLTKLIPIAILIIFFTLLISFRSFLGAFLPLLTVSISVVWTMGIISLLNIPLTVANSVIPVVLISIGTAYSIHIINKYTEETGTKEEKIINTEKDVGIAVILSGLTTAVGFLSLLTADINPVCTLGIFSAVGVLLANLLALIFVPSVLEAMKTRKTRSEASGLKIPEKLLNPYLVIGILLGIVAVMVPFAINLKTDMDIINSINPDERIIRDAEYIGDNFGGNGAIFIDVRGDFKNPVTMQMMYGVEQEILQIEGVNETYSIADIMAKLSKSFCGTECVPSSRDETDNLWFFMENNDAIYQLINRDFTRGIIQVSFDVESRMSNEVIINDIQKILDSKPASFKTVNISAADSAEISAFYSEYVDVSEADYAEKFLNTLNLPIGTLFSENEKELDELISQANDFGDYLLDETNRTAVMDSMLRMDDYDYDLLSAALEGTTDYYEDLAYDLDNLLFVKIREWKIAYFAELLGTEVSRTTITGLLPVSQEMVYLPGEGDSVSLSQTGSEQILLHIQDMLFNDQYESMFMTIAIVFLLFLLQFRSLKIALIGVVPSALTVILNFEIMGLLGISLNTATISIAAIAIGAGIDYAIHFVNRFRVEYSKTGISVDAVRRTLRTSGKAVIYNALSVAFGFFALSFSDIGIVREFGSLTGISMLVAAFVSLVFLSAVFSILKNPLKIKQG